MMRADNILVDIVALWPFNGALSSQRAIEEPLEGNTAFMNVRFVGGNLRL